MTRRKIRILEIGPSFTPRIPRSKNVVKIYIEYRPSRASNLREQNLKVLRGKIQKIPLKPNSFDIVEAHNVLSAPKGLWEGFHGKKRDVLLKIRKILRKNGRLILTNNYDWPSENITFKKVIRKAKSLGFKVIGTGVTEKEIEFRPKHTRKGDTVVLEKT